MAAITAISTLVQSGGHVVCSNMTYGGTYRFFTKILANYGVEFSFVDTSRADEVERAIRPETRCSISKRRPTRRCSSATSPALGDRAERGAVVVVDNTFASPVPAAAARARRRHRHALDDEVSQRTLGHGRRGRSIAKRSEHSSGSVRPEQLGRHPLAHGLVARAARDQDPRRPDGAPRVERPRRRRAPRPAPEGPEGQLPGTDRPPPARAREETDVRLRRA